MKYSENLNLALPEGDDVLEVSKLSENFETLDGAIKETQKAAGPQIGDTLTTWRTDLGENWLLCNGDILRKEDYPDLYAINPGFIANFYNNDIRPSDSPISGLVFDIGEYLVSIRQYRPTTSSLYNTLYISVYNPITKEYKDSIFKTVDSNRALSMINFVYSDANTTYIMGSSWDRSSIDQETYFLATCSGNPMLEDSWSIFDSTTIIKENHPTKFVKKGNLIYGISGYPGGYQIFEFTGSKFSYKNVGTLPSAPSGNASSKLFIYNNNIYLLVSTSGSSPTYLHKLREDMLSWDLVYTTPINVYFTSGFVDSLYLKDTYPNPMVLINQIKESDTDNHYRWYILQIFQDGSVTFQNNYPYDEKVQYYAQSSSDNTLIYYNGYYVFFKAISGGVYVFASKGLDPENVNKAVSDEFILRAGTAVCTSIETNNQLKNANSSICFTPAMAFSSKTLAYIPNFATPKINMPTAYTYIKAKEDSQNADQQTDTPAP